MKKQPTKKKKEVKVMTVPMPKPNNKPSAVADIIGAMASLQASQGWAIIVKILDDNIAYLDKSIIEKADPATHATLSDEEVDVLRMKRSLNVDVRDTPANYTEVVKAEDTAPEEFDPYFKTNKQIIDSKKRVNTDDGR